MIRNFFSILLLALIAFPCAAQFNGSACPELLQNEGDLNKVYDQSKLVFIARITPRNNINPRIYNFKRYDPVLKGKVPEKGFVTFARNCLPRTNDAIYLFMLNSLDEKIQGFNAIFFSLPNGGPGFRWIADWIETKLPKKAAGAAGKGK